MNTSLRGGAQAHTWSRFSVEHGMGSPHAQLPWPSAPRCSESAQFFHAPTHASSPLVWSSQVLARAALVDLLAEVDKHRAFGRGRLADVVVAAHAVAARSLGAPGRPAKVQLGVVARPVCRARAMHRMLSWYELQSGLSGTPDAGHPEPTQRSVHTRACCVEHGSWLTSTRTPAITTPSGCAHTHAPEDRGESSQGASLSM